MEWWHSELLPETVDEYIALRIDELEEEMARASALLVEQRRAAAVELESAKEDPDCGDLLLAEELASTEQHLGRQSADKQLLQELQRLR